MRWLPTSFEPAASFPASFVDCLTHLPCSVSDKLFFSSEIASFKLTSGFKSVMFWAPFCKNFSSQSVLVLTLIQTKFLQQIQSTFIVITVSALKVCVFLSQKAIIVNYESLAQLQIINVIKQVHIVGVPDNKPSTAPLYQKKPSTSSF